MMNTARIYYINKKGKAPIAFTDRKNKVFFEKAGFKVVKDFIRRFRYKNPRAGKIYYDPDGEGVCYGGKDKLISKMLSTKSIGYTNLLFW